MLPGRNVTDNFVSYRTEATLIRSRVTELANASQANLEHAHVPVLPEGNRTRPVEQPPIDPQLSPNDSDQSADPPRDREPSLPVDLNIKTNARVLHAILVRNDTAIAMREACGPKASTLDS
eukprot:6213432-Pleurochrysis_carterae.AAC.1